MRAAHVLDNMKTAGGETTGVAHHHDPHMISEHVINYRDTDSSQKFITPSTTSYKINICTGGR